MDKRYIERLERRLAKQENPWQLTAESLGTLITVHTDSQLMRGTLLAVKHNLGCGLLGSETRTYAKLCTKCVTDPSGNSCILEAELPWLQIVAIIKPPSVLAQE